MVVISKNILNNYKFPSYKIEKSVCDVKFYRMFCKKDFGFIKTFYTDKNQVMIMPPV